MSTSSSRRPFAANALRELGPMALAASIVLVARSSLADHYVVPSGSMLPTVHLSDRILVDKRAYGLRVPFTSVYVTGHGPARGDVVVLTAPDTGIVLLKRVVAVPGDVVRVHQGRVEIDGVRAEGGEAIEQLGGRAHLLAVAPDGGPEFGPTRVPRDQYLVLGDNRGDSHDGRYFGWVSRSAILGRATAVYWRDGGLSWIGL